MKFRAIHFLEYLCQSSEVYIGPDRQQWEHKNALIIISQTNNDRGKILRQRSAGFFNDLWQHNFITCQDVDKWTRGIESKVFQCTSFDSFSWTGVPWLTSHVHIFLFFCSTLNDCVLIEMSSQVFERKTASFFYPDPYEQQAEETAQEVVPRLVILSDHSITDTYLQKNLMVVSNR